MRAASGADKNHILGLYASNIPVQVANVVNCLGRRGGQHDGLALPAGMSGSVLVLPGGEVMQIGQSVVPSSRPLVSESSHGADNGML